MNKLVNQLRSMPDYDTNKIYLLEKTSPEGGFFLFNDRIAFAYSNNISKGTPLTTAYLELAPKIHIKSIANCPSFSEGEFDFLSLKSDSEEITENFIRLCRLYEKDKTIEFSKFVSKMLDLFQPKLKEAKLNAIGLFGELSLITEAKKYGINLHAIWHKAGPTSKFDFSSGPINIEVKTSVGENNSFLIKHSQLFDSERPFICIIKLEKNENGNSLNELLRLLRTEEPYSSDLPFQLALEKELNKSFDEDVLNQNYEIVGYYFYDCHALPTIERVPTCITAITYNYDFDLDKSLPCDEFFAMQSIKIKERQ